MAKFPVDAPQSRVVKALGLLGLRVGREREHIALVRDNPDGTQIPLTMPNLLHTDAIGHMVAYRQDHHHGVPD